MRLPVALLALLAAALIAGCGGDEQQSAATTATTAATTTAADVMTITPVEADRRTSDGTALLVDVREDDEWRAGHAPDAVHVPLARVEARLAELDRRRGDGALIFICRSGNRSAVAARAAQAAGLRDVLSVSGGMGDWVGAGLPLQPADGSVV